MITPRVSQYSGVCAMLPIQVILKFGSQDNLVLAIWQ
nr:MAG TPA: hypothetical protein [Caudoviricetes sp.]